ncbi:hypothetical protein FY036_00710 [Mesorhizobium microcysteis]|uniref:Uncharacterized protein n=1 Tax=Neoaquamicrobium microcysteis TaxID=2682781 RepID=A0A5D4H952_9HYPH|nr:hypothetical protein [Mesorhizobium microcysteis]TYR36743.1 hypothetical protein FY036_00710 [Mesorhizobium microcysteis]
MADSDNTTSLPFVIHRRKRKRIADAPRLPARGEHTLELSAGAKADPAVALAQRWQDAQAEFLRLCERQQKLEPPIRRSVERSGAHLLNGSSHFLERDAGLEAEAAYAAARQAEEEAAEVAGVLLDELARTPARTLAGVVAKLEVLLLESEVGDNPNDFPWPHIRSVLEDLKRQSPLQPFASSQRE